jgi:hypothetical protein
LILDPGLLLWIINASPTCGLLAQSYRGLITREWCVND